MNAEKLQESGEKGAAEKERRDERRVWPSPRGWLSSLYHITIANVSHGLFGCDYGTETRNALGTGHSKLLSILIAQLARKLFANITDPRENCKLKFKKRNETKYSLESLFYISLFK